MKIALRALGIVFICMFTRTVAREIQTGIVGGISSDIHSGGFNSLPAVPKPLALFGDARSNQFFGAVSTEFPFANTSLLSFDIGARLGFSTFSTQFSALETLTVLGPGFVPVQTTYRHTLDISLQNLTVEPFVTTHFPYNFSLQTGLQFAVPIRSKYKQSQILLTEELAGYVTELPDRLGKISSLNSPHISLLATLGWTYRTDVNSPIALRPELSFQQSITSYVQGIDWKSQSLRVGIGVLWSPVRTLPVRIDSVYERDTLTQVRAGISDSRTILDTRSQTQRIEERDGVEIRTILIREKYLLEVPKPSAMLAAEVTVKLIDADGKERPQATLPLMSFVRETWLAHETMHRDVVEITRFPTLHFMTTIAAEEDILDWKLIAEFGIYQTTIAEGTGDPPQTITWQPVSEIIHNPTNVPLQYSLFIRTHDNFQKVAFGNIRVAPAKRPALDGEMVELIFPAEGISSLQKQLPDMWQKLEQTAAEWQRKGGKCLIIQESPLSKDTQTVATKQVSHSPSLLSAQQICTEIEDLLQTKYQTDASTSSSTNTSHLPTNKKRSISRVNLFEKTFLPEKYSVRIVFIIPAS